MDSTGPLAADLANPELCERNEARELFARLRKERPIAWSPGPDGRGFWSVLRYQDIAAVSKNPRLFSSAWHLGGHRIHDEANAEILKGPGPTMLTLDPPEHGTYRGVVSPGFSAERIRGLEASIRARVTELLDRIWSNALVGESDPDLRKPGEYIHQCLKDMRTYAQKLWRERLRRPGEDLVSMLVHTELEGTRNSIAGGLAALSQHPEQRQRLLDNPALIPQAVKSSSPSAST